ncbi:MAG: ectoine hydroxylase [Pirellulaceae bacterium]
MSTAEATRRDPYFSRLNSNWDSVTRMDPVVWGEPAPLTPGLDASQLDHYELNGFHHAQQLISGTEANELLLEANRLAQAAVKSPGPGVIAEPGSTVVRSLFRLHQTNKRFRALAQDPRLVNVARQVLGSDVYVHQSRINFKPGFDGKEFFWHSDFETWHTEDGMPRMRAVSVSVSLTESNEFNGPLIVLPGSHKTYIRCVGETPTNHFEQSLKKQQYGVPSREAMKSLVDQHGMVAPKGPPGSAVFFECNLMHGSTGNLSPRPRTNFFVVYNSVENSVVEPFCDRPPRPEYLAERTVVPVMKL